MTLKKEKLSEEEISNFQQEASEYLLKPWLTREDEPILLSGDGAYFFDARGKKYLDFLSQLFNVNLGMGHKKVVEAIRKQAEVLNYAKNTLLNIPKIELAKRLAEVTHPDLVKTFFSNSGTEANEAAFKIARLYTGNFKFISYWNAYHGSTYASMSAGGVATNRSPYEPLVPGFFHIPPPYCYRCSFGLEYPECGLRCAKFLEDTIKFHGSDSVAAFIADPVVVAAGVLIPPDEYWPMIREICDKHEVLLILDEVIAGCGRTGKLFAYDHWGIVPDILILAKGLSNAAVPLGATVIHKKISDYFAEKGVFVHGFTYSGHALACSAGLAAINAYVDEKVPENAAKVGEYLLEELRGVQDRVRSIGEVRGLGLVGGIDMVKDKATKAPLEAKDPDAPLEERPLMVLSDGCFEEGVLIMPSMAGAVIRLAPPLIINEDDVDKFIEIFERQVVKVEKKFL